MSFSLTPWEEEELQDLWKPTESLIGRRIKQFVRKLKEPLTKVNGHSKNTASSHNEDEKWVFAWEYMPMKTKNAWKSVIDLREPLNPSAKAKKAVKTFITRDAKRVDVNNQYDLEIREANTSDSGWYRCVKRSTKGETHVLRAYFVDVLTELPVTVKQFDKRTDVFEFTHDLVKVNSTPTGWTSCNQCATDAKKGEQYRRVMCYIQAKANVNIAQSEWSVLQFFERIPCRSSLVPLRWRAELWALDTYEEFRECTETCQAAVTRPTRIVNDTDDAGKTFVSDVLPPDEFSISERLPSLRASVVRKTVRASQSDPLVLDCASARTGIQWRKDYRNLEAYGLLKGYDQRIYVNADSQLVFTALELEDEGLYSCFAVPRTVLRTFRVYVREDTRSRDLVVVAQMMIRFAALTLFVILVITVVLSANTHAERHRHANS
ncbi:Protein Y37E11AR.7 [Aphelenchoides avenae]|nr:Protein Y37E11AR.7 [Aphelenchus avenae]